MHNSLARTRKELHGQFCYIMDNYNRLPDNSPLYKMLLPHDLENIVLYFAASMEEYERKQMVNQEFIYKHLVEELDLIFSCSFDNGVMMLDFCLCLILELRKQQILYTD